MTTRTAGAMRRDRFDRVATLARAASVGLVLSLPLIALVWLRLIPPVTLDPTGPSGAAVPVGTAVVAVLAALSAIPALAWVLRSGRVAGATSGSGWLALAATAAVTALAGPDAATSFPGAILALGVVVAAGGALGSTALRSVRVAGPGRWGLAVGLPILAELTLLAAVLSPTRPEVVDAAPWLYAGAAAIGAVAAIVGAATGRPYASAALIALAAALLAAARPGSADGLVGLAVLALAAPMGVSDLFPARRDRDHQPTEAASAEIQEERLLWQTQALTSELADARRMIDLQRAELDRTASIDELTGVPSRTAIMERLRAEVAEARRYPHPVTVVLIDVDRMSELNAEHGTAAGDEVLREVALRLRVRIREADALGRIDGDAFLAILPHTDEAGAAVFAETIRERAVARAIRTTDGDITIRVSLGIALMRPGMDLNADALLARANEALASARAAGGNIIAFDRLHGLARLDERRQPEPPHLVPDQTTEDEPAE